MHGRTLGHASSVAPPALPWRDHIAPDCAGMNFFASDAGLRTLLQTYLASPVLAHFTPHFQRLGELAGGRLDVLARIAERNPPKLHHRTPQGREEDWIEYHPAYREMEAIAFGDFQFHAMSHRAGVLGWDTPLPAVAKYAFQYLFVQGEFGLMCPISLSDTSAHLVKTYAEPRLRDFLLPRMLSPDPATLWKGTQFMTERAGGSDVGLLETVARHEDGTWRLYGDKWFCSHTDADIALILARPEGAAAGTRGIGLFALPRRLPDGTRNRYRIVRLKEKMGTKSMASGEIVLEGAFAWQVGALDRGLKQMMDQVNLSRLSHGVRAAAMMRRCVNEALVVARHRHAFGSAIIAHPLMRRQLLKLLVPAEQALSLCMLAAQQMDLASGGANQAGDVVRILTPMLKFRACRDNIKVATGAMETRGGNGYIEDWVNSRLVRDAQVGLLWEGTSNINAIDIVRRAVGGSGAQEALRAVLEARLHDAAALPAPFRARLGALLARCFAFVESVARTGEDERLARQAASALYHASSAVMLAWEGTRPEGDPRRALHARFVVEHRLEPQDPLAPPCGAWEAEATAMLLDERPADAAAVMALLA